MACLSNCMAIQSGLLATPSTPWISPCFIIVCMCGGFHKSVHKFHTNIYYMLGKLITEKYLETFTLEIMEVKFGKSDKSH